MSCPEFARPIRAETVGDEARVVEIEANEAERAALASRFGLIAIERLTARFTLRRDAQGIAARGRVEATLTQPCSVTADPLPVSVDETVGLRFVEQGEDTQEEVELDEGEVDTIAYEGGAIDLGEAAAETVVLALDPFPRGPGAEAALKAAGVISEEDARPLGALAGLKDMLARKSDD